MRSWPLAAAALLLLAPALAGCVEPAAVNDVETDLTPLLRGATDSLWPDPQNTPHPAFNYPSLSNPPAGDDVPAWFRAIPAAPLPDILSGLEHVAAAPLDVESGAGIAIFGGIMVVPGFGGKTSIVDITDPTAPVVLSTIEQFGRGAAMIPYPDGRLVFVMSAGRTAVVYDITDPTDPLLLASLEPENGSHKISVVPGTPIVYNANSRGAQNGYVGRLPGQGQGQIEIYDLTDPENPVLATEFKNGYGCHHIYFWITAEKQRALCAGIQFTQILDVANPLEPTVVMTAPFWVGPANAPSTNVGGLSHYAILNEAGNILIVGDETLGGGGPGCDVGIDTPTKRVSGPIGNVWFYDVSDEREAKLLGWFDPGTNLVSNPEVTSCTAHHGRLVPDPAGSGREILAMAYYGAGVVLIDFTDPTDPRMVDQWNDRTDTWEVWYYNGWLFTGDLARGMDVLKLR